MDLTARLVADVPPTTLLEVVSDLGTYPDWLDIVEAAVTAPTDPGDAGPAWEVTLRGQIGPLRRLKRLRMVRTESSEQGRVRFERSEVDGRSHSPWVLTAGVEVDDPVVLEMSLHYGGSLWVPMLDRLLREEIERSKGRLVEVVRRAQA